MANQISVNSGSGAGAQQVIVNSNGNISVVVSRGVIGTVANVASANYANFAGTVVNPAQPNITSLGTLANLAVSNTITTNNLVVNGNFQVGNLVANSANYANFAGTAYNVSGANVTGAVANATYATSAGSANTANTATVANSANTVAGANVTGTVANATYAVSAGSANTANSATVAASANSVALANVSGAGNIASINLDGNVSNVLRGNGSFGPETASSNANYANFAGTAYSVDGANVNGTVANATYAANAGYADNANIANIAYNVDVANVSGIGNIATINLDGNASNVLHGDGTFGPEGTTGNANYANFAGTVVNATQSNIKQVGNLVALTVNNNVGNTPTYQFNPNLIALPTSFAAPNAVTLLKSSGSTANLIQVDPQYILKDRPGNAAANSTDFVSRIVYAANSSANGNINIVGDNFVRMSGAPNVSNTWTPGTSTWRFATTTTNLANSGTFTTTALAMNAAGGFVYTQGSPSQLPSFGISGYGLQNGAIGNVANAIAISIARSRGNGDSRLTVEPNDYIGDIAWNGQVANGALGTQFAKLRAKIDSSYVANTTTMPIGFELQTVNNTGGIATHNFYANGNVAFNNAVTANTVTANYLYGDGSNITNITATNANYANFAGNAYSVDAANVVGLGNIATINLDGNASNLLDGTGNWVAIPTPGGSNYANFAGQVVDNTQSNITQTGNLVSLTVNDAVANSTTLEVNPALITFGSQSYVSKTTAYDDGNGMIGQTSFASVLNNFNADNTSFFKQEYYANDGVGTALGGRIYPTTFDEFIGNSSTDPLVPGSIIFQVPTQNSNLANINTGTLTSMSMGNYNGGFNVVIGAPFNAPAFNFFVYGNGAGQGQQGLRFRRRNGNADARQGVVAGDYLGNIEWQGGATATGTFNGNAKSVKITPYVDSSYAGPGTGPMSVNLAFEVPNATSTTVHTFYSNSSVNFAGPVTATSFAGDGGNLSNINAANISGAIPTANYAAYAGNVTVNAQPNITSVGTLTGLNVSSSNNITLSTSGSNIVTAAGVYNWMQVTNSTGNSAGTAQQQYVNPVISQGSYMGTSDTGCTVALANTAASLPGGYKGVWRFDNNGNLSHLIGGSGQINAKGINITGNIFATGFVSAATSNVANTQLAQYQETTYNLGSVSGTITPDFVNGSIQNLTLTGNITLNSLGNAVAGRSMTLILTQDATGGRTLTSSMKFAGGSKTLSTAGNAIDIISVFYDGTTYYASLSKGYA